MFDRHGHWAGIILSVWLLGGLHVAASAATPQPPCGTAPYPASAGVGEPAAVMIWRRGDLPDSWSAPECLSWKERPFAALIAVSGRIGGSDSQRQLLARFLDTSAVEEVRYWSHTRKRWRLLFSDVAALDGPDPERTRPDFDIDEVSAGRDFYVWQKENSLASGMVFRNRVLQMSEDRLVLDQVNVTGSFLAFVEILGRGEFETAVFVEREQADVWRYYSLSRIGGEGDTVTDEELASPVNRLVALFRYLAGVPTDGAPPAMR